MTKAVFYHAGCPVCVSAEQQLLGLLSDNVQVEVVHLGNAQRAWRKLSASACRVYRRWWSMGRCCTSTSARRWRI